MRWETKQGKQPFWERGSQKHRKPPKRKPEDDYVTTHRLLTKFDESEYPLYRDAYQTAIDQNVIDSWDIILTKNAIYGRVSKRDFGDFWRIFDALEEKRRPKIKSRSLGISTIYTFDSLTSAVERTVSNG